MRFAVRRGSLLLAGASLLVACSGGGEPSAQDRLDEASATPHASATSTPRPGAPGGSSGVTATGAASAVAATKVPVAGGSAKPNARPSSCPTGSDSAPNAGGDGMPISYTGTGTGSYTTPDGTGVTYAFPPRWTYVWRAGEQLVELTATDALGTWGIAAASADEDLSRIAGVYLTAPDGTGGSMTFPLRFATPIAFTALKAGGTANGRAADESVLVTIHRPGAARVFELTLRDGRCRATDGIGAGSMFVALDGAAAPWSAMRFDFDVRIEDDQLKGSLQLHRG